MPPLGGRFGTVQPAAVGGGQAGSVGVATLTVSIHNGSRVTPGSAMHWSVKSISVALMATVILAGASVANAATGEEATTMAPASPRETPTHVEL